MTGVPAPLVAGAVLGSPTGRRIVIGASGAAAAVIAVLALAIASMIGSLAGGRGSDGSYQPSAVALADIPGNYLALYLQAGRSRGLDWAVLAGVGSVETDHGRGPGPGITSGVNAHGCCAGPMQFSIIGAGGGTWGAYAVDGNHDGRKDVYDPGDAIPAAADLLKASGAPGNYHDALFAYNHAEWYVAEVLAKAALYRGAYHDAGAAGALGAGVVSRESAAAVLRLASGPRPRITLTAVQRNDLATGQIDPRVSSLLVLIARTHTVTITALKSDHSIYTTGGNVSNHSAGRAVDIAIVDGEVCNSVLHGPFGKCWRLARQLAYLTGPLHPSELIFGIDPDGPGGPAFAASDHTDHVHAGWDAGT